MTETLTIEQMIHKMQLKCKRCRILFHHKTNGHCYCHIADKRVHRNDLACLNFQPMLKCIR